MVNIYIYISDVCLVFLVLPVVSLTYIYYTRHKKDMVCREGKVNKRYSEGIQCTQGQSLLASSCNSSKSNKSLTKLLLLTDRASTAA